MNNKLLSFNFLCWLFVLVAIPVGTLENLKLAFLTFLTLAFIVTLPRLKIPIIGLMSVMIFIILLMLQAINTLTRNFDDTFIFIQARSIILILITISYYLILSKNNLVNSDAVVKTFIYGVLGFSFFKITVTYAIFNDSVLIDSLGLLDFYPIGNLGHPGVLRFAFINDFFIPFAYYLTVKTSFSKFVKYTFGTIFFIMGILSMTRYIWLMIVVIVLLIHKRKFIFLALTSVMIMSILVNEFTEFKIIDAMSHRAFIEGADSAAEKSSQSIILLEEASNYPIFGKGLGSYVESYIRNERIKYGYEVFYLLLIIQFGLPVVILIITSIYWKLVIKLKACSNKIKIEAFCIYTLILGSGFFNPTIMSAGTVVIFISINEYYLRLNNKQNTILI